MKSLYYFFKLFIFIVLIVSGVNIKSQPSLVIGGDLVDISVAPWQVSVEIDDNHVCGGVIINEHWILTATHCFTNLLGNQTTFTGDNVKIHAGWSDQTDNENGQRIEVDLIKLHPNWNPTNGVNDLALLRLKKPLCFDDDVKPVLVNPGGVNNFDENTIGFTTGWGSMGSGCCSQFLYGAQLNFIQPEEAIILYQSYANNQCTENFADWINAGKICFYTDGISAGSGDSGGPIVVNINGIQTLVGITHAACNPISPLLTLPTLFTDVGLQSTFINSNLAPKDITISTTQTNLDRSVINGNIIVKAPAVLTINTNIYMMPGKEIIVENGAKLILDEGRITSIDGDCPNRQRIKNGKESELLATHLSSINRSHLWT